MEELEEKLHELFESTYIHKNNNNSVKKAAIGSIEMAHTARLRDWAGFELLSKDFDFKNKLGLDMGAGLGSDSIRLLKRGAKLVCMDYNPVSINNGSLVVPEAQWLGGNSECLPFVSDTFDFTVANAALHHMNDVLKSVKEMYRVTKPGGYVFLISDPFTRNVKNKQEHDLHELNVFEGHPIVMNGVNEGVIPFNLYAELLESLDPQAKILTMKIHDKSDIADTPTYWVLNQENKEYLGVKSGNISSVIKVSSINLSAPIKNSEDISTELLFRTIGNPSESMHFLLPYLSSNYFDDFPFMVSSKFYLMNGWHVKQAFTSDWRKGYSRIRLFFTKSYLSQINKIMLKRKDTSKTYKINMYMSINGKRVNQFTLLRDKCENIPMNIAEFSEDRNVIEIGVADKDENKGALWSPYDSNKTFWVKIDGPRCQTPALQRLVIAFTSKVVMFKDRIYSIIYALRR